MLARDLLCMVIGIGLVASAHADTIATFEDPSPTGATPLFTFVGNNISGVLSGGYSGTGLNLVTPGLPIGDFADATFVMAPVSTTGTFGGGLFFLGAGSINFFDVSANPLLTISFDSAFLSSALGVGASDFTGFNVTFSGPILAGAPGITDEAFSFSFANPVDTGTGFTVTSAFTSSATIPTPGAVALLGLGGLFAARRRR